MEGDTNDKRKTYTKKWKILHDEYMRGYRKGYREGRDVIVGNFDDKMKELKNEIAEEAVR